MKAQEGVFMSKIEEIFTAIETGKARSLSNSCNPPSTKESTRWRFSTTAWCDAMTLIGERAFSRGEAFVPEMLISAAHDEKGRRGTQAASGEDANQQLRHRNHR
jgi:hypothetical protein